MEVKERRSEDGEKGEQGRVEKKIWKHGVGKEEF